MKKLGLVIVGVLVMAMAGLFWLRGNLDGLVKDAIASYGSTITQTQVSVGAVEIRSSDGTGIIRDLRIGNPGGFKTAHALKVREAEIAIDISSLASDVVVIRKIAIKAPDVIYEKGDSMTNFDAIQKNIAASLGTAGKTGQGKGGGKKLIVEEFTLRDARAQVTAPFMSGKSVAVPLPDIILHNLGKARGGMAPGELGQEISQALKQKLSSTVSFDSLAKSAGQAVDNVGNAIKGLFGK